MLKDTYQCAKKNDWVIAKNMTSLTAYLKMISFCVKDNELCEVKAVKKMNLRKILPLMIFT